MVEESITVVTQDGQIKHFNSFQISEAATFYRNSPGSISVCGQDITDIFNDIDQKRLTMSDIFRLVKINENNSVDIWNFDLEQYETCWGIECLDHKIESPYEHCFASKDDGTKIEFVYYIGENIGFLPMNYSENGQVIDWTCCKDKTLANKGKDGFPLLPYLI